MVISPPAGLLVSFGIFGIPVKQKRLLKAGMHRVAGTFDYQYIPDINPLRPELKS